jgi:hypothetical protein
MAFTELGVAMLSSVLNSQKAINIHIEIMRAFVAYRGMAKDFFELSQRVDALDAKLDHSVGVMLGKIDEMTIRKAAGRRIGFKQTEL